MAEEKGLAKTTSNAVKELVKAAKETKAKKEALKFMVEVFWLQKKIDTAKTKLETYVNDCSLGEELVKEALLLSEEEIAAVEELIGDNKETCQSNNVWVDPNGYVTLASITS